MLDSPWITLNLWMYSRHCHHRIKKFQIKSGFWRYVAPPPQAVRTTSRRAGAHDFVHAPPRSIRAERRRSTAARSEARAFPRDWTSDRRVVLGAACRRRLEPVRSTRRRAGAHDSVHAPPPHHRLLQAISVAQKYNFPVLLPADPRRGPRQRPAGAARGSAGCGAAPHEGGVRGSRPG